MSLHIRGTTRARGLAVVTLALAAGLGASGIATATTGWTAIDAPNPVATGQSVTLTSTACTSAGNCVAVGYQSVSGNSNNRPIIDTESGGTWSVATFTSPGNGELLDVTCPAAGHCVAVGYDGVGGNSPDSTALIETLSAGSWTATDGPAHSLTHYADEFVSVSCATSTSCAAVGNSYDDNYVDRGLIDTLAGTTWTPIYAPEPISGGAYQAAALRGVSCGASGSCEAVGYATDSDNERYGLVDVLSSGSWTGKAGPTPSSANGSFSQLDTIDCSSAAFCGATGLFDLPMVAAHQELVATLSGGTWSAVAAPIPAGEKFLSLSGISCPGTGSCVAVGSAQGITIASGLIETLSSGAWRGRDADVPANGLNPDFEIFNSVDCASATNCVGVGTYEDPNQYEYPLIDTITGATDTAIQGPEPANTGTDADLDQSAQLNGVQCTTVGACTAVGYFYDTNYVGHGLIESEGTATPPSKPAVTALSPTSGGVAGGTKMTISGTDLTGATAVHFGAVASTHVRVLSATQLTALIPPHSAGTVDVKVTTASGTSASGSADRYTYVAAPVVKKISPKHGSHKGGKQVTIHGSDLKGATEVQFGGVDATDVNVVSPTKIKVTSPKHAKGKVDVIVTTPGGTSSPHKADHFKYK